MENLLNAIDWVHNKKRDATFGLSVAENGHDVPGPIGPPDTGANRSIVLDLIDHRGGQRFAPDRSAART
jgi:hypothetical protein